MYVIQPLANAVLPSVIFYLVYLSMGIIPAMTASLLAVTANAVYTWIRKKRITITAAVKYRYFSDVFVQCTSTNAEGKILTFDCRRNNTQLFGFVGLALSTVAILFTENEKFYYVPALVSNCVFFCFAIGLTIRKKSILHFIMKDFKLNTIEKVSESRLFTVNIIWCVFFLLKILSKTIGILFLDFNTLYWLVFILGDPMTVVVVGYSIYHINRVMRKDPSAGGNESA